MSIKMFTAVMLVSSTLLGCGAQDKNNFTLVSGEEMNEYLSKQYHSYDGDIDIRSVVSPPASDAPIKRHQHDLDYWYTSETQFGDTYYDPDTGNGILISAISPSEGVASIVAKSEPLVNTTESLYLLKSNAVTEAVITVGKTRNFTGVSSVDVINPTNPELLWNLGIEGNFLSSYKGGDILHILTERDPEHRKANFVASLEPGFGEVLEDHTIKGDVRSRYVLDGQVLPLSDSCLRENSSSGYQQVVNITSVNLRDKSINSVCFLGRLIVAGTMSSNSVFLVGLENSVIADTTNIHAFKLTQNGAVFSGSKSVPGLTTGIGSMGVHEDTVRIMTFEGDVTWLSSFQNVSGALEAIDELPDGGIIPRGRFGSSSIQFYDQLVMFRERLINFERGPVLEQLDGASVQGAYYMHPVGSHFLLSLNSEVAELFDLSATPPALVSSIDIDWRRFNLLQMAPELIQSTDDQAKLVFTSSAEFEPAGVAMLEINGLAGSKPEIKKVGQIGASSAIGSSLILGDSVFYTYGSALWSARWGKSASAQGPSVLSGCEGDKAPGVTVTIRFNGDNPPADFCQWGVTAANVHIGGSYYYDNFKEQLIPNAAKSSPVECVFEGLVQQIPRDYDISLHHDSGYSIADFTRVYGLDIVKGNYCKADPTELTYTVEPE